MGQYYKTVDEFKDTFISLLERIMKDPETATAFKSINKITAFNFTDPDLSITVDPAKTKGGVTIGEAYSNADIKVAMSTDAAHRLLLGEMNPMAAIMSREIRVAGSFQTMNKLVKMFSMASQIYRDLLVEKGMK